MPTNPVCLFVLDFWFFSSRKRTRKVNDFFINFQCDYLSRSAARLLAQNYVVFKTSEFWQNISFVFQKDALLWNG